MNKGGIGFLGLLTLAFIVLRLTDAIEWSWWWVLSPLWIACLVALAAIVLLFILAVRSDARDQKRRQELDLCMRGLEEP